MNIESIKSNNTSGADEILQHAGHALHNLIKIQEFSSATEAQEFIIGVGKDLILSQPRMAPIINLVNRVFIACNQADERQSCQARVLHTINNFLQLSITAKFMLVQQVQSLLKSDAAIATYSRSSMVIFVLSELIKNQHFSVYLTEARPMLEGRQAALELTDAGIPVTLLVDAALQTVVDHCDIALVGVDTFNGATVINKTGTSMLARLMQAAGKPVYALCTMQKYLNSGITLPGEQAHAEDEVWSDRPENITIVNKYFEDVPLHYFTGVITENGIINTTNLHEIEQNVPLHPWLVEILGNHKE